MSTEPDIAHGEENMNESKGERKGGTEKGGGNRIGTVEAIGSTQDLRDELHHVGGLARDAAHEQYDQLKQLGMDKARQIEDHIVDQPLKSVAIAAGVGFVLGLMWMRR